MLKKTIEFEDLDGNKLVEEFYFHLSKAELTEMHVSEKEGFYTYLMQIIESDDGAQIMEIFKKILSKAYGVRSEDNRRFIKSEKLSEEFMQTNAYDVLFMELVTDEDKAAEFINGIMPKDLVEEIEKTGKAPASWPERKDGETPAYILEDRPPTKEELQQMNPNELRELMLARIPSNNPEIPPAPNQSE